jgi:hypothetical protein
MPPAEGRPVALAVLAAAAATALAGCGGSRPPSVANVRTTASSSANAAGAPAGSAATPTQAQLQQGLLKYAGCMRSSGVPGFPDPSASGGFEIRAGSGVDPSSPAFRQAQAKCRRLVPGGLGPTPGATTHPSAPWLAHMVGVAQCMRRHGVSGFPDPRTSVPANPFPAGATGMVSDIEGVILVFPGTLDTQSPLFTRAASACGFPLHNH